MKFQYLNTFDKLFFNIDKQEEIKEIYTEASSVFDSIITEYGELFYRILDEKAEVGTYVDTVIVLLIRKIIEQIDAINVLYSVASHEAAQNILRSLIENIVGLRFILKENTEERAAAYYLDHNFWEMDLGDKCFNENTKEGKQLINKIGTVEFNKLHNGYEKKKLFYQQMMESNDTFQKICILREEKKKQKPYIKWYEVCSNVKSVLGLFAELGLEKDYFIYRVLSKESHGSTAISGKKSDNEGSIIKLIRNPVEGGSTFELTCTFASFGLYDIFNYLKNKPDEIDKFKSYLNDITKKGQAIAQKFDLISVRYD